MLVTTDYWTLLLDKGAVKTLVSPLHRAIVVADRLVSLIGLSECTVVLTLVLTARTVIRLRKERV